MKNRQKRKLIDFELTGTFLQKNRKTYIFLLSMIAVFELIMLVRGLLVFNLSKARSQLYLASYTILGLGSLSIIPIVAKSNAKHVSMKKLSLTLHIYAFFIMVWSLLISILDMQRGGYPIVYLTILVTVGGVVVISPAIYMVLMALSMSTLLIVDKALGYNVIDSTGAYFNIIVFLVMSFTIVSRQYVLLKKEKETKDILEKLSYKDILTGLGNETAYFANADRLTKEIKKERARFGLFVLDVNLVKKTNDRYGHRYGCHLIRETGKRLPSFFSTSSLYHIGGDEFVVVLEGSDYGSLDEIYKNLASSLEYESITFEGKEITLSVAVGKAVYRDGMTYNDVFQEADGDMYRNKEAVKEKYGITGR